MKPYAGKTRVELVTPIPWEEIDPEIKDLVMEMNYLEGIVTLASCQGHKRYDQAFVTFNAETFPALFSFVQRVNIVWKEYGYKIVPWSYSPEEAFKALNYTIESDFLPLSLEMRQLLVPTQVIRITGFQKFRFEFLHVLAEGLKELRLKYGVTPTTIEVEGLIYDPFPHPGDERGVKM